MSVTLQVKRKLSVFHVACSPGNLLPHLGSVVRVALTLPSCTTSLAGALHVAYLIFLLSKPGGRAVGRFDGTQYSWGSLTLSGCLSHFYCCEKMPRPQQLLPKKAFNCGLLTVSEFQPILIAVASSAARRQTRCWRG